MDNSNPEAALIAEQLAHAIDMLKAEYKLANEKIARLEQQASDFEQRIRELTASTTQFKLLVSLSAGGGLLSIISLMRALLAP